MWNKGVPLGNKGVARLLLRENKRACPTYQVCIERESVPTVTSSPSFVQMFSRHFWHLGSDKTFWRRFGLGHWLGTYRTFLTYKTLTVDILKTYLIWSLTSDWQNVLKTFLTWSLDRDLQNVLKTFLTWWLSRDLQNIICRHFKDISDLVID
jgi:hypothetical protein